jgi:hypothetical protein
VSKRREDLLPNLGREGEVARIRRRGSFAVHSSPEEAAGAASYVPRFDKVTIVGNYKLRDEEFP